MIVLHELGVDTRRLRECLAVQAFEEEAALVAEQAMAEVAARTGLEVMMLRPPLVYGPGVKAKFLALMCAIARGWSLPHASIENRRSLIYAGNLCEEEGKP